MTLVEVDVVVAETETETEVARDASWYVVAGLVLRLQEAAVNSAHRVIDPALWLARPLLGLAGRVLPDAITWRVGEEVRQLAREGRAGVAVRGQEARAVVTSVGTIVVQDALVADVVKQLIDRIGPDLIAELLPSILDQLADESTKVQNIVRGQSRGMVEEIARDARSRAAVGDDVVDRFVARLLHRNPNGSGRGSGADLMPKG